MRICKHEYLLPGRTNSPDWTDVVELVVESRLDDDMKRIVSDALAHGVPVRMATDEARMSVDSYITGANL